MELVEMGYFYKSLKLLVPGGGVEPPRPLGARDFKSLMSTSSITQATKKDKSKQNLEVFPGDVNCLLYFLMPHAPCFMPSILYRLQ